MEKQFLLQMVNTNYLSDLEYSTRECSLKSLKKSSYKDLVDMKHRMKLTPTETKISFYMINKWNKNSIPQ